MQRIGSNLSFDISTFKHFDNFIAVFYKYAAGLPGMYSFSSGSWEGYYRRVFEQSVIPLRNLPAPGYKFFDMIHLDQPNRCLNIA